MSSSRKMEGMPRSSAEALALRLDVVGKQMKLLEGELSGTRQPMISRLVVARLREWGEEIALAYVVLNAEPSSRVHDALVAMLAATGQPSGKA